MYYQERPEPKTLDPYSELNITNNKLFRELLK